MLPQLMDTSSAQQPLLPRLPGGAGEARRQGLPLARHHGAGPAHEPQRRAPRLSQETPEESRGSRGAATTRSPTSSWPRARSTSPSATRRPRSTSRSWPSSATAARRSTAASLTPTVRANLRMSCLPESLLDGQIPDYDEFQRVAVSCRRKSAPGSSCYAKMLLPLISRGSPAGLHQRSHGRGLPHDPDAHLLLENRGGAG